jgi:hypothetical protein
VIVLLLDWTMAVCSKFAYILRFQEWIFGQALSSGEVSQLAMSVSSTPAYYLIMAGGSLTIVTSLVTVFYGALYSYYNRFFLVSGYLGQPEVIVLTLLPGLGVLYLGQRFLKRPEKQLQTGLLVAAISVVGLFGVVGSAAFLYVGIFFSGPPISFTGGIIGAFLNRTGDHSPVQPNPQN